MMSTYIYKNMIGINMFMKIGLILKNDYVVPAIIINQAAAKSAKKRRVQKRRGYSRGGDVRLKSNRV